MLVEREQRNKIFHYLNEKGLPWEEFEFTEMEDGRIRELGLGNLAVTARMNMRRRTHITQAVKVLGFGDPIDYTDAFDEIDTQMEAGHKCRKIVEIHDRQTLTVLINDDWEIEDVVRGDALKEHPEGLLLTMIRMEELIPVSERTIRFPIRLRAQQLSNANEEEILKLAIDMSEALEEAHKRKIIHRDVKLENIFYDEDGIYKLGDFGIARMEDAQLKSRAMTRGYGAPEIDRRGYDERVDMYSLGMTLYLLLNDLKFPGSRSYRVNEDLQYVPDAVLPEPVNGSPALKAIIMKMCAYSPKDRYASMTELRGLFSGMLQKRYKENGMEKNRVLLKDLLQYDPITIQVPDHPEAGALAGASGLYCYFSRQGIDTRLVCGGSGNYRG
ncbi:MAG: protein kinase, partial [Eubacterium sp.]|nr:protein kinase [Eubacterium sp.]